MNSIPNVLAVGVALLWGVCVLLRCVTTEQVVVGSHTRPQPRPRGVEWRKVRRFGRKVVAVRLQVILA